MKKKYRKLLRKDKSKRGVTVYQHLIDGSVPSMKQIETRYGEYNQVGKITYRMNNQRGQRGADCDYQIFLEDRDSIGEKIKERK
jgi:hypothetical protein